MIPPSRCCTVCRLPSGADHPGRDRGPGQRRQRRPDAAGGEDREQHREAGRDRRAQVAHESV